MNQKMMIITLATLLVFFRVMPTVAEKVDELLFEDWEQYKIGTKPHKPWKTGRKHPIINVVNYNQSKVIEIAGSDTLYWEPPSEILLGEFCLEFDISNEKAILIVEAYDRFERCGIIVYFRPSSIFGHVDITAQISVEQDLCKTIPANEMTNVKIVGGMSVNPRDNRYSVIVNDLPTDCMNRLIQTQWWWDEKGGHLLNDLSKFVFNHDHWPGDLIKLDNINFKCINCGYNGPISDDDDDDDTHWELEKQDVLKDDNSSDYCGC